MAIKFHLDEHAQQGIAIGLRSRGIDTSIPLGVLLQMLLLLNACETIQSMMGRVEYI